ncbi:MAG: amidase, partial [Candidatus Berkiella sp.]
MIPDYLSISHAAKLIKSKELSPVELVESRIKRIERLDGKLHSFITLLADEALIAAKLAEKEIASGTYKGPLHGIPIGLKDVFETAAIPTTCHSKVMKNHIPKKDAHVVTRLKQAGAIVIGKLALHEFSLGGPSNDLPWPLARNPWDTTRFAGGSSSGTGVAVAAGFVLGGTATDAGGSLRGPAALCGAAGIKPTYGLVSRTGILPLSFSLDHAGPVAWTTEDCALLLQSMAGFDASDTSSAKRPIPDYSGKLNTNIKGLRIGLLRHFYTIDVKANTATIEAIDHAAKQFEEMGCIVSEVKLSPLSDWANCGTIIMLSE